MRTRVAPGAGGRRWRGYGSGRRVQVLPRSERMNRATNTQKRILAPAQAVAAAAPKPQIPKIIARIANKIASPSMAYLRCSGHRAGTPARQRLSFAEGCKRHAARNKRECMGIEPTD